MHPDQDWPSCESRDEEAQRCGEVICPTCHGLADVDCPQCEGAGYVPEAEA